jgi:hypothetical protein
MKFRCLVDLGDLTDGKSEDGKGAQQEKEWMVSQCKFCYKAALPAVRVSSYEHLQFIQFDILLVNNVYDYL